MTIKLLTIGKTDNAHLETLMNDYQSRLNHYIKFELEIIPDLKKVKHLASTAKRESRIDFYHDKVGYNYKMPNINAALGFGQINKIYNFLFLLFSQKNNLGCR